MSKELLPYKIRLTKKQWELLKSFRDSMKTEILFWGGWRWGKTWWIAEIICYTCVAQPGIVWGIWRNEWEDLRKSSLLTVTKVLNSHGIMKDEHYWLNMQTKELLFINGSKIFFIPLKQQPSDPEFNFLWGYELTHGFVDEAQEVSRKAIDVFKTRFTEKVVEYGINPKLIMACNPMHWHLYYDFIKADEDWTLKPDRVFIQSLYKDNPFLDHAKYEAQYANSDKITKERLLKWNWKYDQTPGRLFEFDALSDLQTNAKNNGEKFVSVDVAREWRDGTVIVVWDGYEIVEIIREAKSKMDELSEKVRQTCQRYGIGMSHVIADENGVWGWLVDNLRCVGFINNARPVQAKNATMSQKRNFEHLKTQCYYELARLVNDRKIRINCDSATFGSISEELDAVVQIDIDKDGPYRLIKKEDVRSKIGRSPDFSDAIMMRCYFEYFELWPTPAPVHSDPVMSAYDRIANGDDDDLFEWIRTDPITLDVPSFDEDDPY